MNAITFDTHRFVKKLTAAGMPEAQAEVLAEEQAALIDQRLATKSDLTQLATKQDTAEINERIMRLEGQVNLVKWMLALVVAATVIPLIRDLF